MNNLYELEVNEIREKAGFEMKTKDRVFSLFVALLIIPFVVLTLWGGFNIGYTLSFITCTVMFSIYLLNKNVKFRLFPWLCVLVALTASAVYTVSSDTAVRFFLFFPLMGLVFIWLVYLGGYDISDDYSLVSAVFIGIFGSAFGSISKSLKGVFSFNVKKGKGIGKAMLGLACSVPAVLLVVTLLRNSDAAFDGLLSKIGDCFGNIGAVIFKSNVGLLFFPFIVSLGLGLAKNKRDQKKWCIKGGIDKTFVISFMSAIVLVYVVYILSQLAYFFSAFRGILPAGEDITFASYARRGFFEMTIIAAINFVLISLAALLVKKNENGKRNGFLNSIIVFIGIFTLLLIATALSKMFLYIENKGMTRLRILTSVFMVFLAILFIAVILRAFIRKIPVIKTGLVAAVIILTVVGFADVDRVVAQYNLFAYEKQYTESLDIRAIGDLGEGGIETLYYVFDNQNYEYELRFLARDELINACEEMYEINYVNDEIVYERKREIGDFNFSKHKAYEILDKFIAETKF